MKMHFKNLFHIMKEASMAWYSKDPFRESAVIAYYAIFSLPGLLVVIITLAGYVFGQETVSEHVQTRIAGVMGPDTGKQVEEIIAMARKTRNSIWGTIIGIATILAGATGVFAQFQKSLNTIWEVKTDTAKSGILYVIRVRLFSFGLIVAIAFILVVSLVISTLLAAFGDWLSNHFSDSLLILLLVINFLVTFITIAFLFAFMFKFFPDAKVQWRHVWIGAIVTALLFEIGKFTLELYFGKATPGDAYGAASSIILILLWVSYSSMIVFFGAEFTHAYANFISGKVAPTAIATKDPQPKPETNAESPKTN